MKKGIKGLQWAFWTICLGAELTVATDLLLGFFYKAVSLPVLAGIGSLATVLLLLIRPLSLKIRRRLALGLPVLGVLLLSLVYAGWQYASQKLIYAQVDQGKGALYADHKVMVIVPHEDDDLNIAGGILEEYTAYGSEVWVVFVTNGDAYGLGQRRINEAIACCDMAGIGEDHVIFLGYGDQWDPEGPHIYNGEPDVVYRSYVGNQQTYGTENHPAYRESTYTVDNFLGDLESVILEYRPDTILCSDYDPHIDHRALTLAFEKVMGRILRQETEYTPTVYKAFAYSTSWLAQWDFYGAENLGATENVFAPPYDQSPAVYRWEERLRFPVAAQSLSRFLVTTGNYQGMGIYSSQNEKIRAQAMTNSDKVFWQRRTDSLCYQADVQVSTGNGDLLTDFMLLECGNLVGNAAPTDGTWVPEGTDVQPAVQVTFGEKQDVSQIVLYDNPDENQNVLDAVIIFDGGTEIQTGPLDPGGAATVIPVEKKQVSWFSVTLLEREGETAGLTEVEAYADEEQAAARFLKLVDEEQNFVYDYWMDPKGTQSFGLYSVGLETEHLTLTCQGEGCEARLEEGAILVTCPVGRSCVIRVEDPESGASDSAVIRNPGTFYRIGVGWIQKLESQLFGSEMRRTVTVRALLRLKRMLL